MDISNENKRFYKGKHVYIYILVIIFFGIIMCIRNMFGFDWSDETSYTVGAYRLLIGDRLFEDMWGVGQFGTALLLPFVYIYDFLVGSTEGIMIFSRIVYNTFNIFISIYIFLIFKDRGNRLIVLTGCVAVVIFAPGNVAAISYNTLSLQMLLLSGVLIAHYLFGKNNGKFKLLLSGLSYGFAVQMYPGLILAIFVIPAYLFFKKETYGLNEGKVQRLLLWTVGGLIVILLFFLFVIYNSSLGTMVENFYRLFEVDEAKGYENRNISGVGSIIVICIQFLSQIKGILGISSYVLAVLTLIFFLYSFFCKKEKETKQRVFIILWVIIFAWILIKSVEAIGINYINMPLALTAPMIWCICNKKSNVCILIYVLGLFESFAIQTGSNNGIAGSSYGLFLCSLATILYLGIYIFDNDTNNYNDKVHIKKHVKVLQKNNLFVYMSILICVLMACSLLCFRFGYVYRDDSLLNLTSRIETGPAKGIYTTPKSKAAYEGVCHEIRSYALEDGTIFISKLLPFGYLLTDLQPSTISVYRVEIASPNLEQYYKTYPDKEPKYVFVLKEDVGITNDNNPLEGYLGDILLSKEYKCVKLDYSNLYIKRN